MGRAKSYRCPYCERRTYLRRFRDTGRFYLHMIPAKDDEHRFTEHDYIAFLEDTPKRRLWDILRTVPTGKKWRENR